MSSPVDMIFDMATSIQHAAEFAIDTIHYAEASGMVERPEDAWVLGVIAYVAWCREGYGPPLDERTATLAATHPHCSAFSVGLQRLLVKVQAAL